VEAMTIKWLLLTVVPLTVLRTTAPKAARSGWNVNAGSSDGGTIATSRSFIPSPMSLRPVIGRRASGRLMCDSLQEGCR